MQKHIAIELTISVGLGAGPDLPPSLQQAFVVKFPHKVISMVAQY
jgi:hypothetical protein